MNPNGISADPASRSPFAALRRYARAHREVLEASVAAFEVHGDRNLDIPLDLFRASDEALNAVPAWLRCLATPVERHVASRLDYRHRTGQRS
jgi:hypothetical protein